VALAASRSIRPVLSISPAPTPVCSETCRKGPPKPLLLARPLWPLDHAQDSTCAGRKVSVAPNPFRDLGGRMGA